MSTLKQFQKELEKEAVTTRKMLAIVPNDKYDWKPHPKSMTIKQLATHIAELPTWISMVLNTGELDFASNPYQQTDIKNTTGLLEFFDKNFADGKTQLETGKEEQLNDLWTLRNGKEIYSTDPKAQVLRMIFSQIIHHRAQLGVFLRLLDVPIPGSYGPSADDMKF